MTMTTDQLASMRRYWQRLASEYHKVLGKRAVIESARDEIEELVIEVERLQAENTAMREIVQAVADADTTYYSEIANDETCVFCGLLRAPGATNAMNRNTLHKPECPVTQARALLAT